MKKFLITAAALMAGTAALAQTPPPTPVAPPAPMAHPMHDRVTTRAEAVAMVRDHFGRLDANKDGSITTAEVAEGRATLGARFRKTDGRSRDPGQAFDRIDADRNGSIDRDEFAKAHEQRIERRAERKERAKDRKSARRQAMRMHGGRGFGGRMIVMADTDKDGRTTLAEAEALALQHFDRLDTNRDGQVTPEERRAGRPMMIRKIEENKGDS